ncbi:uncharacterized protein LOC129583763 [Paramacrobiotus metropolitanus]|uniref:uncharacterized protein LOC129583763 n=1 Tax=Paramacrobiotus metropolitanus TaxID=2943436 RepID=UPI0024464893|nr:uncharacterized protein LOC129583763 [Paramacrobiotus metropolitanus]
MESPDVSEKEIFGSSHQYFYKTDTDFIARGSFGIVYKAVLTGASNLLGTFVAVKVVHVPKESEILVNLKKWTNWGDRMKILLGLAHEHIAAYHKITITRPFRGAFVEIVMDYYHGGDLACFLYGLRKNGIRLDRATATRYAIEITDGVHFLHQKGLVHGDLKPGNVFIKHLDNDHERDTLVIGDLDDFVQMQRSVTCSGDITHVRGTIRFMSPEMLKRFATLNSEIPGRKTDIWSVGCIMLELAHCITGSKRKRLKKNWRIVEAGYRMSDTHFATLVIDGYVPAVTNRNLLPAELVACMQRCLHRNSEKRVSADELLKKLLCVDPLNTPAIIARKEIKHTIQRFRKHRGQIITDAWRLPLLLQP